MLLDESKINKAIDFSGQNINQTNKVLFKYKKFLAKFLQLFLPMFKDMSIEEIINQSIDWYDNAQRDILFQESTESNSKSETEFQEDFIVMLRFPDHLQGENQPKYFILHIGIQETSTDLDRKQEEYTSNLNYRFNISLNKQNEELRRKNLIPIYSVWIILHPEKWKKGLVEDFNVRTLFQINPVSGELILDSSTSCSTKTIRPYRINLDDSLDDELKNIQNIIGFLSGFFNSGSKEELNNVINFYDMHISEEFEEQAKNMVSSLEPQDEFKEKAKKIDACLEYQFEKGFAQGFKQGLAQSLEAGDKEIQKITQGLIKEMGFSPEKAEEFIKKMLGSDSEVK